MVTGLPAIKFRPVMINEGDQFVSLMNRTYNRKQTIEYFKWQFFDSPLKSVLMGAFIKDRLVGSFGLQCRKLNNGLTGGQAIDLIIDEELRGRGVFRALAKEAIGQHSDSVDFYFSFTNPSGKEALCGSSGFKTVKIIRTLVLETLKLKVEDKPAEIMETWDIPGVQDNSKPADGWLYFLRDSVELKWRFGDNPDYKYAIIKADGDTFAVVKIFIDPLTGENIGDIVDFSYRFNDGLEGNLVYSAAEYLKNKSVSGITCWPSYPDLARVLRTIGFEETDQERYFCVNALHKGQDYLYEASKWCLVEADAEIY